MSLNINKLQEFLQSKGLVPNKYFIMDGMIFYIEIYCIKTADIFYLYIPSKYNFAMEVGDSAFKIKYVDMTNDGTIADRYAGGSPNDAQIAYNEMHINLSPDKNKLEEQLENAYRHPVTLKDVPEEDGVVLKSIQRQMKRFKFSVQNIKYKLNIVYKNYICAIRRDDSIDCMIISNYPSNSSKKLFVAGDLEMLYEKGESMIEDVKTIRNNIYRLLETNQNTHSRIINNMIRYNLYVFLL